MTPRVGALFLRVHRHFVYAVGRERRVLLEALIYGLSLLLPCTIVVSGVPSATREFHFMIRNISAKEKWTAALGHHVAAIRK